MPSASSGNVITDTAQIAPGVIQASDIGTDVITATNIAPNAVGDSEIAAHTTTKITVPSTLLSVASQAQGDLLYHNGTNWVRLAAGTTGLYLKTLGAGQNPAWTAISASKRLGQFITDVSVTNTTTETTLFTFSLTGGDMGTNDIIHVRINFSDLTTNGGSTMNLRCYFGATSIDPWNAVGGTMIGAAGYLDFYIYANGATNAQILTAFMFGAIQSSDLIGTGSGNQVVRQATGTAAIDTTSAVTVKVTLQAAAANALTVVTAIDGFAVLYK